MNNLSRISSVAMALLFSPVATGVGAESVQEAIPSALSRVLVDNQAEYVDAITISKLGLRVNVYSDGPMPISEKGLTEVILAPLNVRPRDIKLSPGTVLEAGTVEDIQDSLKIRTHWYEVLRGKKVDLIVDHDQDSCISRSNRFIKLRKSPAVNKRLCRAIGLTSNPYPSFVNGSKTSIPDRVSIMVSRASLPDGYTSLTSLGLRFRLKPNEAIASVLSHEFQHAAMRFTTQPLPSLRVEESFVQTIEVINTQYWQRTGFPEIIKR